VISALLLVAVSSTLLAAEGYEAMGHITSTSFDASGVPRGKRVIMFEVRIGRTWSVHEEPVIECKNGVAFQEGFSDTNNCIWFLTGFEAAYKPSRSPFQQLRAELKESKKEDVYFVNPVLPLPPALRSRLDGASQEPAQNAAVATVLRGQYAPMDSSYSAFLWFAFTPPSRQTDGTNQMLLQIWDDGNSLSARFRRAKWTQFPEPPNLVSGAVYNWVGKEFLCDGKVADLPVGDVSHSLAMAASYEVGATTNFAGLTLPSRIKLTRYATEPAGDGTLVTVWTDDAVVTSVRRLSGNEPSQPKLPGRTFVSDHRLASVDGRPVNYFLDAGPLPPAKEVEEAKPRLLHSYPELR
jgi:hypothetical protein